MGNIPYAPHRHMVQFKHKKYYAVPAHFLMQEALRVAFPCR
jgi:hypothetical protein